MTPSAPRILKHDESSRTTFWKAPSLYHKKPLLPPMQISKGHLQFGKSVGIGKLSTV